MIKVLPFLTLLDYEASLLRLMEKLTNGSKIEIDVTGVGFWLSNLRFLTDSRNFPVLQTRNPHWWDTET